ncbi:MAG: hypothetical protein M3016_01025 [Actinomycetota bacterium]|nr:hypothetical protein [Actinomycetota bacterium]
MAVGVLVGAGAGAALVVDVEAGAGVVAVAGGNVGGMAAACWGGAGRTTKLTLVRGAPPSPNTTTR